MKTKHFEILAILPDAVVVSDEDGRVVFWNPAAEELCGIPASAALGEPIDRLIDIAETAVSHAEIRKQALESGAWRGEVRLTPKGGGAVLTSWSAARCELAKGRSGCVSIIREIADRNEGDERLRPQEALLHLATEVTSDAIYAKGPDGRYLFANKAACSLLGKSADEVLGRDDYALFPAEEAKQVMDGDRRVLESGAVQTYEEHVSIHGEPRVFLSTKGPFLDPSSGQFGLFGIARDITERKRAEAMLKESEERYRALSDLATEGMLIHERGVILDANRAFGEIVGRPAAELIGKNGFEVIPFASESRRLVMEHSRTGEEGTYDIVIDQPDGRRIHAETSGRDCVYRGRKARLVTMRDLTAQREGEEALRASENRFRLLLQNSNDVIEVIDQDGVAAFISEQIKRTLGYEPEEWLGRNVFEGIHPDDFHRVMTVFAEGLGTPGGVRQAQYRYRHKNGSWVDLEAVGCNLLHDPAVRGIVLNVRDITERKRFEQRLLTSEERYRTLVETAQEGMIAVDADHRITFANQQTAALLGYAVEELLGREVGDFVDPAEREAYERERGLRSQGRHSLFERNYRRKDGQRVTALVSASAVFDADGRFQGGVSLLTDITERVKWLREAEMMRRAIDAHVDGAYWLDREGRFVYVNDAGLRQLGYGRDELIGQHVSKVNPRATPEAVQRVLGLARSVGGARVRSIHRRKDGSVFPVEVMTTLFRAGDEECACGFARDVTDLDRAEQKLRQSEAQLSNALQMARAGHWEYDVGADLFTFNDSFYRIFRTTAAEVGGYQMASADYARRFCHPDDAHLVRVETEAAIRASDPHYSRQIEHRMLYADGEVGHIAVRFFIEKDAQGRTVRTFGVSQDITERKRAETELRNEKALSDAIIDSLPGAFYVFDQVHRRIERSNAEYARLLGLSPEEVARTRLLDHIAEDHRDAVDAEIKHVFAEGQGNVEADGVTRDGRRIRFYLSGRRLDLGEQSFLVGVGVDVTERRRAEETLRASEARYRAVFEQSIDGIFQTTPEGRAVAANPAFVRMLGYDSEEEALATLTDLPNGLWADPSERNTVQELIAEHGSVQGYECQFLRKHGARIWVSLNATVFLTPDGRRLFHSSLRDITARKEADEEKKKLQDQLQQAMKMEAVGRLAGGIAHDFNNLLTGIAGNVELALEDLFPDHPLVETLEEVRKAADSAASLTRQLLAFSRKQLIEPKVVDLNELIASLRRMLARLIGEDIELETHSGDDLWPVKIDRGQFEQILVNLAVNARDAMPNGGRLITETANVELGEEFCRTHSQARPGKHVMLAVSDTGTGMSEETKLHLFEPFFTTKEKSKGTGLGLATIYGAVRQAGGSIQVYSELGRGTTFKMYLPRVEGKLESVPTAAPAAAAPGGDETILFVEDDRLIRELAIKALKRFGYRVLAAGNGEDALAIAARRDEPIDLLLTDVVMPGMNGRQLAQRLAETHPETRVLFTSGYTENAIAHHGVIDEELDFIGKPYTLHGLATAIRKALGSAPPPARG